MPNNPNAAANLKPFEKGDPRINRKGKPKSFDQWRALLLELAAEPAVQRDKDNSIKKLVLIQVPKMVDGKPILDEVTGQPVMVDHYATNAELIARQWMSDPKRQAGFVEGAFGKVPQPVALQNPDGSALEIVVKYADNKSDTP